MASLKPIFHSFTFRNAVRVHTVLHQEVSISLSLVYIFSKSAVIFWVEMFIFTQWPCLNLPILKQSTQTNTDIKTERLLMQIPQQTENDTKFVKWLLLMKKMCWSHVKTMKYKFSSKLLLASVLAVTIYHSHFFNQRMQLKLVTVCCAMFMVCKKGESAFISGSVLQKLRAKWKKQPFS